MMYGGNCQCLRCVDTHILIKPHRATCTCTVRLPSVMEDGQGRHNRTALRPSKPRPVPNPIEAFLQKIIDFSTTLSGKICSPVLRVSVESSYICLIWHLHYPTLSIIKKQLELTSIVRGSQASRYFPQESQQIKENRKTCIWLGNQTPGSYTHGK